MTPTDLTPIRAWLARAVNRGPGPRHAMLMERASQDVPIWLAALLAEVERLRESDAALQRLRDHAEPLSYLLGGLGQAPSSACLEDARRVWLEVVYREPGTVTILDDARRERDDYRAEVTRLRATLDSAPLEERARIVAWLRTDGPACYWADAVGGSEWSVAANAIEAAAHLEPRT